MNNIYLSIYLPIQEVLLSTKDWELFVKARGKNSTLEIQRNYQNQILTNVFSMLKALMEK